MISTPSPLLNRFDGDAGDQPVMPEAAVAHDRDRAAVACSASPRRRSRATCRSQGSNCPARTARTSRTSGSRCRREMCVGPSLALHQLDARRTPAAPDSRCRRSAGAAGKVRRAAAAVARLCAKRLRRLSRDRVGVDAGRSRAAGMRQGRRAAHRDVYSPAFGSGPLPCTRVLMSARRSSTLTACSM